MLLRMDPLCHSLVGACLAEAGLGKRTALATATLVIGANLPDVDVFAYFWGPDTALGFRRGWTHGVLALALWPFVLTGIMMAWDRFIRRRRSESGSDCQYCSMARWRCWSFSSSATAR